MSVQGGDGPTWQDGVLGGVGAPFDKHNRMALSAWAVSVGMPDWTYNWLGSTYPVSGAVNLDGSGVKVYPHYSTGIAAIVAALKLPLNRQIITALRNTAPYSVVWGAVHSSAWPRDRGDERYPSKVADLAFGEVKQLLTPTTARQRTELYDWSAKVHDAGDTLAGSASRAKKTAGAIVGLVT